MKHLEIKKAISTLVTVTFLLSCILPFDSVFANPVPTQTNDNHKPGAVLNCVFEIRNEAIIEGQRAIEGFEKNPKVSEQGMDETTTEIEADPNLDDRLRPVGGKEYFPPEPLILIDGSYKDADTRPRAGTPEELLGQVLGIDPNEIVRISEKDLNAPVNLPGGLVAYTQGPHRIEFTFRVEGEENKTYILTSCRDLTVAPPQEWIQIGEILVLSKQGIGETTPKIVAYTDPERLHPVGDEQLVAYTDPERLHPVGDVENFIYPPPPPPVTREDVKNPKSTPIPDDMRDYPCDIVGENVEKEGDTPKTKIGDGFVDSGDNFNVRGMLLEGGTPVPVRKKPVPLPWRPKAQTDPPWKWETTVGTGSTGDTEGDSDETSSQQTLIRPRPILTREKITIKRPTIEREKPTKVVRPSVSIPVPFIARPKEQLYGATLHRSVTMVRINEEETSDNENGDDTTEETKKVSRSIISGNIRKPVLSLYDRLFNKGEAEEE